MIFQKDGLKDMLALEECVEVDNGYNGDKKFKSPRIAQSRKDRKEKSQVQARHEIVNRSVAFTRKTCLQVFNKKIIKQNQ